LVVSDLISGKFMITENHLSVDFEAISAVMLIDLSQYQSTKALKYVILGAYFFKDWSFNGKYLFNYSHHTRKEV